MGPRVGLDGCAKSRPNQDLIPGPSSPYRVALPATLSQPTLLMETESIYENMGLASEIKVWRTLISYSSYCRETPDLVSCVTQNGSSCMKR